MIEKVSEKKVERDVFNGLKAAMATVNEEFPIEPAVTNEIEKDIRAAQAASIPKAVPDLVSVHVPVEYHALHTILRLAFEQSAFGKGKDRHATGPTGFKPWLDQPINSIGRMVGAGYAAGQVQKKVQEAVTMAGNGNIEAAKQEALGAIVYAAALYQHFSELAAAQQK